MFAAIQTRFALLAVLLIGLLPMLAHAQEKAFKPGNPADYLTESGNLKERLEIQTLQGGTAGYSGNYFVIDPDGSWDTGSLFLRGRGEDQHFALERKGKLTAAQLKEAAMSLANHDLAGLKNHGEVEVNPRILTIRFGKKEFELLPGKGKATAEEDKAIRARYEAIAAAVTAQLKVEKKAPVRQLQDVKGVYPSEMGKDIIASEKELERAFGKDRLAKLLPQVNFAKEKIVGFGWTGSSSTYLSFGVKEDKGKVIVIITMGPGLGEPQFSDNQIRGVWLVMPRQATWESGKLEFLLPGNKGVDDKPRARIEDYLTKGGKLKERLVLSESSGPGIAAATVTSRTIETDGKWALTVVETVEENKKARLVSQGTLNAADLAHLARGLVRHDLAGLPNLGDADTFGPTTSVSFGKRTSTHYAIVGGAASVHDKAIHTRYAAIAADIKTACPEVTTSPLRMRLIAKKDSYVLDLGGKSPAEFRKLLDSVTLIPKKGEKTVDAPPGPMVDLVLEITNTTDKNTTIWVGGDDTALALELRGPGAVSKLVTLAMTADVKISRPVEIPAGKSYSRAITSLTYPSPRADSQWYWTEPGEYTLSASWRLGARLEKGKEPNLQVPVDGAKGLVAPPIKLRVTEGEPAKGKAANPKRIKGMKAAVADVEAGDLKWIEIPLPYPGWYPTYVDLLKKECGVQHLWANETHPDEMEGYNDVMNAEIERRFGKGVLERLHKRAFAEYFNKDKAGQKVKADDQPAKKKTNTLDLDSELLPAKLSLPEARTEIAAFSLKGNLTDQGEGKGKLALDVKKRHFNEIGEVAGISDTANIVLDCTFKYVKTMKTKGGPVGPPTVAIQEWRLYELKGEKITTRLSLAMPVQEHQSGRLLIQDKDGKVLHVIQLHQRVYPGCHPGCFPVGTLVQTPKGARPIDHIHAGDMVTTVRPDGTSATGQVQTVFVTQNRLVKVESDDGVLITTLAQPLCLADGQIRATEELTPGDQIFRWRDGKRVTVTVRSVTLTDRQEKVFNLILGDCEAFIASGFLARSKPPVAAASSIQQELLRLPMKR